VKELRYCKECNIEYEIGVKDFCSDDCFKKNIKKRINEATESDPSHTNKISKDNS